MHLRPALTRLLVLLLLLQWGSAFGHCLRLAAPGDGVLHMDICSADGPRSITITLDDQDNPPQDHAAGMICPLCGGYGGALPPPPVAIVPALLLAQAEVPAPPSTPSPAPPPRCQPQPRAPPTS
ncbi:DUF2946 family protein [Roseomonas sp. F4]